MFNVKVMNHASGLKTHGAQFDTMEEVNAWIAKFENHPAQPWGKLDIYEKQPIVVSSAVYKLQNVLIQPEVTEIQSVLIQEEIKDEEGNVTQEAIYEDQEVVIQEAIYEEQNVLIQPEVLEMETVILEPEELDGEGNVIKEAVTEERIKLIDVLVTPKEYEIIIEDITAEVEKKALIEAKAASGRLDRMKCEKVLDVIAGFNRERTLTMEQITEMQTLFANAEKALRSSRPDFATSFISAIEADGILITQEMKDICLELLA